MLTTILSLLRQSPPTEQQQEAVLKGRLAFARSGGCPYADPQLIQAWERGWKAELDNSDAMDPDWLWETGGRKHPTSGRPA